MMLEDNIGYNYIYNDIKYIVSIYIYMYIYSIYIYIYVCSF